MDYDAVIKQISQITVDEQAALDFKEKTGRVPENADLLEIYSINVLDYIPKALYEAYRKNKSSFLMPKSIPLNERLAFDDNESISLTRADRFIKLFPLRHDFYMVNYLLEGKCEFHLEEQSYTLHAGDIVIVPPKVVYQAFPEDDCLLINLKIRKSKFDSVFINFLRADNALGGYFSKTLYSNTYRTAMIFHCKTDDFLCKIFLKMIEQQTEKPPYYNYMLEGLTVTLFSHLIQKHIGDTEMSDRIVSNDERMNNILSYIQTNFRTATLQSTAEHFYLNSAYLSTLIKKELKKTFSELVRDSKISAAAGLLLSSEMKIDDICEEVGYKDTTQFIKSFKKQYGLSPKQYRKTFLNN